MGAGLQNVIRGGGKDKDNEAEVSDQALHVKVIGGGGSGPTSDVNIASVGGNPVTTTVPVSGTVTIQEPLSVDDNGGSLTVDGAVDVSGSTVTIQEPLSVDDNGAALTVDTTTRRDDVAGGTDFVFPPGLIRVDALGTLTVAGGDYALARVNSRGATWVKHDGVISVDDNAGSLTVDGSVSDIPVRSAITNIINAQLLDDSPTSVNSSSFDVTLYRHLVVYIDLAFANTPSNIRLIAQFDRGSGNWFDYSVDQWVDLRYVPGQMPLVEAVPLNYVVGTTFRLRAVATGTTAANTFTISAWVEGIN